MTALQEEAGFEPWHSPRSFRRAFMRAGIGAVISLVLVFPQPLVATAAWVLVPAALFEVWCQPRVKSTRRAHAAAAGLFGIVFVLMVAAYFQLLYVDTMVRSGSMTAGMDFVGRELTSWIEEPWYPGGPVNAPGNNSVYVLFLAQVCGVGCATAMVARGFESHEESFGVLFNLCLLVPAIDWIAYSLLHQRTLTYYDPAKGLIVVAFSSFLLGIGSIVTTAGMLVLSGIVDWLERRVFPPTLTERQAPV